MQTHLYTKWFYDVYNIAYTDYILIIKVMYANYRKLEIIKNLKKSNRVPTT